MLCHEALQSFTTIRSWILWWTILFHNVAIIFTIFKLQGIALKYEEEFKLALESFAQASALDPTWQEPRGQEAVLLKYLQVILN